MSNDGLVLVGQQNLYYLFIRSRMNWFADLDTGAASAYPLAGHFFYGVSD